MDYSFCQAPQIAQNQCIILGIFSDQTACERFDALDKQTKGLLTQLQEQKVLGETLADTYLVNHSEAIAPSKLLLVNCGKSEDFDGKAYLNVIKKALTVAAQAKTQSLCLLLSGIPITDKDAAWTMRQTAQAIEYQQYKFEQFKSKKSPVSPLENVCFCNEDNADNRQALRQASAIGQGVNFARDLGNLPGNVCTPTYLAEQAQTLAKTYDIIKTTVIEESEMHEMGMGAFLSVAKGSEQRGKLIEMHYSGGAANEKPVVLVGKGITFDAGGISLKPAANMDEMKYDMCGAASVFGTVRALAEMKLKINVVALVAAAENLPSGIASKPGDIVTSMSGQTIEILNTDAEGRLVLCDTLTYAERFEPRTVIDIATLTGAMVIALGHETTGFMSNDDSLAEDLLQASQQSEDKAWRMPMTDDYQQYLDSNFADMANVGSSRAAGSITAACFLSRFTKKFRWAHVDNAGSAWVSGKAKGATGRPVPMLSQLLINYAND